MAATLGIGALGWTFTSPASFLNLSAYQTVTFGLDLAVNTGSVSTLYVALGQGSDTLFCAYPFAASAGSNAYTVNIVGAPDFCYGLTTDTFKPSAVDRVAIALDASLSSASITMTLSDVAFN